MFFLSQAPVVHELLATTVVCSRSFIVAGDITAVQELTPDVPGAALRQITM